MVGNFFVQIHIHNKIIETILHENCKQITGDAGFCRRNKLKIFQDE